MKKLLERKINWRTVVFAGIFALGLAISLEWGYQLETDGYLTFGGKRGLFAIIKILVYFLVAFFGSVRLWRRVDRTVVRLRSERKIRLFEKNLNFKMMFVSCWIVLLITNFIVLLAVYPGFFVYDAQDELNEVLTRTFTMHHPLLHVYLLGGIIAAVHKVTGSWNAGIFTYIFMQMIVITAIFAYVLAFLRQYYMNRRHAIYLTFFYGCFPTIVMFTLCSCKDGLFSAFLLLTSVLLIQLAEDQDSFLASKKKVAELIFSALLMMLFRHNGIYAYMVFIPVGLFLLHRKVNRKTLVNMAVVLIIPLVAVLMINSVCNYVLKAASPVEDQPSEHQEMLTVPLQQLGRVYRAHHLELTQEEIDIITSYIPEENLDLYTPKVSDLLKVGFNNKLYEQDKKTFWKIWAKELKKYPAAYLNAWFLTSYGYWYPFAVIDVYRGTQVFTFTYEDSSYFGYEVELPGERHSLIPAIDELYRKMSLEVFQQRIPLLSLLFAPGAIFWSWMFMVCYLISRHRARALFGFVPIFMVWLTVLLGPTYLVRYVLILWTGIPLMMYFYNTDHLGYHM